jgi:predicted CoA-binding protein
MAASSAATARTFVSQKKLAIAGVSRSGKKFGNAIMKELASKGYEIFPVHPEAEVIDGRKCARSFADLSEPVGGVIVNVKPEQAISVVRGAHAAGITRVWLQQGAQSDEAIAFCGEHGMDVVSRQCILMFAEPVDSIHKFHRFFKRLFGGMPA